MRGIAAKRSGHEDLPARTDDVSEPPIRSDGLEDLGFEALAVLEDGRPIALNANFRRLLGRPELEACDVDLRAVFPDQEPDALCVAEEEDGFRQAQLHRGNDEQLAVEIAGRTISFEGRERTALVVRDLGRSSALAEETWFLAYHDALTGLANRSSLLDQLEEEAGRPREGQRGGALLAVDLDRFKDVNDRLGHPVGDKVLVKAARRLRSSARGADVVARLGGDEFAVLLHRADAPAAQKVAERIVEHLSRPMLVNGHGIEIGASVGIAFFPQDGSTAADLLHNADLALYEAKRKGKGRYAVFDTRMNAALQERLAFEQDLRKAVARCDLELAYLPLISLSTKRIVGFEALLRWEHPERGSVPPREFIPVAEDCGLIGPVGEWTVDQACSAAAEWPNDFILALNVSGVQLDNDEIVGHVRQALERSGLPPHRLQLEVTEELLIAGGPQSIETLQALKDLGTIVAMDNFGTGYSSLNHLRSFPFDKVKIDRSFVSTVNASKRGAEMVRAIVGLGRALGLSVTAAGIEDAAQLDFVGSQGCDEGQGFQISQPVPREAIAALLQKGEGDVGG